MNVLEHTLIQFVRHRKAPSALIQDGFLDDQGVQSFVEKSRPWTRVMVGLLRSMDLGLSFKPVYGASGCDVIAAYGDQTRDVLIRQGVRPETINVTGAPRFDDLFSAGPVYRDAPGAGRTILVLGLMFLPMSLPVGSGKMEHNRRWLGAIHALALQKPTWNIILRPHPSESLALYREELSRFGNTPLILDRSTPIQEVLRQCHALVVNYSSTIVLEATILGVPVVLLDLHLPIQQSDYTDEKSALLMCEPEDLLQALEHVTDASLQQDKRSQEREVFLRHFLGYADGRSAQRISNLIDGLYVRHNVRLNAS